MPHIQREANLRRQELEDAFAAADEFLR